MIPNGVSVARYAGAEPLPGWPGEGGAIGFLGRFTEPRKGFPVLLDAFVRLAAAAPGAAAAGGRSGRPGGACWRTCRPTVADRITFLGLVDEERQGADAAQRRRVRRAEHRRRVVRHDPHRGDGGRYAGRGERPGRVPAGARRRRRRCSRSATPTALAGVLGDCWTTRPGGPSWPTGAARWWRPTTGRRSPRRVLEVYHLAIEASPGRVRPRPLSDRRSARPAAASQPVTRSSGYDA